MGSATPSPIRDDHQYHSMLQVECEAVACTPSPKAEDEQVSWIWITRVKELEEQLRREAEQYRTIIAKMAATCRALQARIRILEAERSSQESEGRRRGQPLRRRTWHTINSIPLSPLDLHGLREPMSPREADMYVFHSPGLDETVTPPDDKIGCDDVGLLLKAWLWY